MVLSASPQPRLGPIFVNNDFLRSRQQFAADLARLAFSRQRLRELFGQSISKIDMLNAALLEQAAPRTSLRCAGNLAAIEHKIGIARVAEACALALISARRTCWPSAIRARRYRRQLRVFTADN